MLTPLSHYNGAKYPTKEQIQLHPELLRIIPRRWAHNPVVLTALGLVLSAGLTACGTTSQSILPDNSAPAASGETAASNQPGSDHSPASVASAEDSAEASVNDPEALDIPIFAHGTGRGSYGCESVAPPVFLSEEEAMQVIAEECAAQGIDISGQKTISGTFPATSTLPVAISDSDSDKTYTGELQLDGYSEDLGIGVEFVSTDDIKDWRSNPRSISTVDEYDLKGTAQRLVDCTDNVAVFYDPTADDYNDFTGSNEESYVESSREKSLEELREQVRDFLQWLKGQGVI
jgi:hypothetical protein